MKAGSGRGRGRGRGRAGANQSANYRPVVERRAELYKSKIKVMDQFARTVYILYHDNRRAEANTYIQRVHRGSGRQVRV